MHLERVIVIKVAQLVLTHPVLLLFQAPSLEDSVDYHFVAFVEKDGVLYDLDGRKPGPLNCGSTTKETFLKVCILFNIFQQMPKRFVFTRFFKHHRHNMYIQFSSFSVVDQ